MRSTPARRRPRITTWARIFVSWHRCSLALLTGTGSCILHRGDLVWDIQVAEVRTVFLSRRMCDSESLGLTTDNRHGLHPCEASRAVLVRCTP